LCSAVAIAAYAAFQSHLISKSLAFVRCIRVYLSEEYHASTDDYPFGAWLQRLHAQQSVAIIVGANHVPLATIEGPAAYSDVCAFLPAFENNT
jgi:hypothetical protein